jgi:hypothetical protein
VCTSAGEVRNVRGWLVFLGKIVAAKDDDESGYAHALRWYSFKPIAAWRGIASAGEVAGRLVPSERR